MTFISEKTAQILHAKRNRTPLSISAVGSIQAETCKHSTHIRVSPRNSSTPSFSTTALIFNSLTSYAERCFTAQSLSYLVNLQWADPNPLSSYLIDIIIGADLYTEILQDGIRKGSIGQPIVQNSALGWFISGPIHTPFMEPQSESVTSFSDRRNSMISSHHGFNSILLEEEIKKFWESEELPRQAIISPQDKQCDNHFLSTYSRDSQGRYIV